jgi:hypothetical protein
MPKNFYFNYDSLKSKNYYRRHIDKQQMKEIQDEIQKEMEKMRKELKKNKIDKPSLEEKKDTVKT